MKPGPQARPRPPCSFDGCVKPTHAHGLCNSHYDQRFKRNLDLTPLRSTYRRAKWSRALRSCWRDLISRCTDPENRSFSGYGGRGVKVCQRWLDSFDAFAADMGERPSPEYSIDRKNNDGNYEPDNCKWATITEQGRNTRRTKLSPDKVQEIKRQVAAGDRIVDVGARFGIHHSVVSRVANGKAWT